jgi:hypothetical protein
MSSFGSVWDLCIIKKGCAAEQSQFLSQGDKYIGITTAGNFCDSVILLGMFKFELSLSEGKFRYILE